MRDLLREMRGLSRRPFVRGVAVVAGGTAIAQVITVLIAPITSRQYGPEAYGVLGVFLSTAGILASLAGLAYGFAIALPKRDEDALALLGLAVRIAVVASLALAVCLALLREPVAALVHFPASAWLLLPVAAMVLFSGLSTALSQWLIRKKRFKQLGSVTAGQSAAVNGGRVALGFAVPSSAALIVVSTLGSALSVVLLYFAARVTLREAASVSDTGGRKRRRAVAREYRDFPLYREPQMLLNAVSGNIPVLLLAAYFGPAVAGLYGLGCNVLALPAGLVSDSVGKVFLPHVAEAARRGEDVRRLIVRATGTLALLGLVPFGLVVLFGPQLFGLVFGADWTVAGQYARWLALWFFFAFVNVPCVQTVPLLGLQAHFLAYEVVVTILRVAAILVGALVVDTALAAIVLFSIVGVAANLALIVAVAAASGTHRRESL